MSLGNMEQRTAGIKKQAQELIEQAYQRGYKAGYEACKEAKDVLIAQGRNEAWEAARKIDSYCGNNKPLDEMFGEHGIADIKRHFTASEAIEKIRAYEEQKKQEEDSEIHVGDEVKNQYGFKYFITGIKGYLCWGIGGTEYYQNDIRLVEKTGRTFPEITEVLKKLKEGEELIIL